MGYPAYQTVKITKDDGDIVLYCSKKKVNNHNEGRDWISSVLSHFGYQSSQIKGKPQIASSQPDNAIIYPS